MKVWLLTAAAAVCFLKAASAQCSNNPCTGTDYRSYSSCLSNQCPETVVATGCSESKCSSIDCDKCSSSSSCCQSCCRPKCECSSVRCDTCSSSSSSACCNTCCQIQDCCTCTKREECCHTYPQQECCKDKSPITPVIPSITLPNITIVINQSAPYIYNTLNQACGGITTVSNGTHIVTTTGTCSHDPKLNQPCCIITQRPQCPFPFPPFRHCPPPVHNYACGPQCIIQPQMVIAPPPPIMQPVIQPPPQIIQPVIQTPPQIIQPMIQPPPQIIHQVIQPPPQIIQPVIQPQPQVIVQPQPVSLCHLYPVQHCPQQCYGLCYVPRHSGCFPIQQWPFMRCGYGGSYFGGFGGIGGSGGIGGIGGIGGLDSYIGQDSYGGYGVGAQTVAG